MRLFIFLAILFVSMSPASASDEFAIDKILILKEKRKMYLLENDNQLKEYDISLGFEPVGAKDRQGDGKTPEGVYKITGRNPGSRYHKSLRVSYPGPQDIKKAKELGVDPGGDIMIHGLPNGMCSWGRSHLLKDWTLGCIAVTCKEIEEIWDLVNDGTIVEIRP